MIVQATKTFTYQGRIVRKGETFATTHPIVRENADKFGAPRPVEDATADPGRRR